MSQKVHRTTQDESIYFTAHFVLCQGGNSRERGSFLEANNVEPTKRTVLPAAQETCTVMMWECGGPFQRTKHSQAIHLVNPSLSFMYLKIVFVWSVALGASNIPSRHPHQGQQLAVVKLKPSSARWTGSSPSAVGKAVVFSLQWALTGCVRHGVQSTALHVTPHTWGHSHSTGPLESHPVPARDACHTSRKHPVGVTSFLQSL